MQITTCPTLYNGTAPPKSAIEFRFKFPHGLTCPCNTRRTIFNTPSSFKLHQKGKGHKKWLSLVQDDECDNEIMKKDIRLLNIKNTELSNEVSQLTTKISKVSIENTILKKLWVELRKNMHDLD